MANGRFVNDYSFLNLPELGSAVRSPIEIAQESLPPSVLQQIDFSAPRELPQADLLTRGGTPNIIPTRPQGILGTQNFKNILERAVTNAEAEIQMLREAKIDLTNQYEQAVVAQDALKAKAAEDQLAAVNAKEQELLTERANIIAELEQGFDVEREGFQTNIANLEGTVTGLRGTVTGLRSTVTDLQANIDALTQERDAAIAEQDVIRATAAEEQAKALADQKADLQGQIDTLRASQPSVAATTQAGMPTPPVPAPAMELAESASPESALVAPPEVIQSAIENLPVTIGAMTSPAITTPSTGIQTPPSPDEYLSTLEAYNPDYLGFEDERAIGRQNEADALANLQAASAAGTASLSDVQAAKDASANLIAQRAYENRSLPITRKDLGIRAQRELPVTNPIPTDIVSQLQNMNVRRPNLNLDNLRVSMAGGGDINKIDILLKKIG